MIGTTQICEAEEFKYVYFGLLVFKQFLNLQNYHGDPYVSCRAECVTSGDCPSSRQVCQANKCIDPCNGVCGINANCRVRDGTTAVCSCPKDMTGDPFVHCRPFEKRKYPPPRQINSIHLRIHNIDLYIKILVYTPIICSGTAVIARRFLM